MEDVQKTIYKRFHVCFIHLHLLEFLNDTFFVYNNLIYVEFEIFLLVFLNFARNGLTGVQFLQENERCI